MYLKVSVLLCFFSLTATANINSSQSFFIETDKFKSGTQSASAGTAISLGGDNFTFTLPQMTASEAEKKSPRLSSHAPRATHVITLLVQK